MRKILLMLSCIITFGHTGMLAQTVKRVNVDKAGTLISHFTEDEANSITHLVVTGKINTIDFKHLRDGFNSLEILDLSNVDIKTYAGKEGTSPDKFYIYPPNCIPAYAFCRMEGNKPVGKLSLRKVILSDKTKNIEDAAFKGCFNLRICQINRKNPPNLLPEGLKDSITALFVPFGSRDDYRFKKRYEHFAIIEGEPVEVTIQVGSSENLRDKLLDSGLQPKEVNFLTIEGKLDKDDFGFIRDYMPNLVYVDLSKTTATSLPNFTFAQKKSLMGVKLPNELTVIGERAFSGCERLSGIVELPASVTTIDYGAFMDCVNLEKVIVTSNKLTTLGANIFGDETNKFVYPYQP